MAAAKVAPCGAWKSPITSELIVSETISLGKPLLDGEDIYWLEGRPAEGGRNVIVKRTPDGTLTDLLPQPFNARTRVHEYGGGSFTVHEGTVYFSNYSDQRLYRLPPGGQPEPLTPEMELRYADGVIDVLHRQMICVREDHRASNHEALNTIVGLNLTGDPKGGQVLTAGNDFYATPRLSPDGRQLAWLTWEHPNMPWDATALWVARVLVDGRLDAPRLIAGGADESIYQPAWSPDGVLHFISDRTGWWNLYRWREGRVEPLLPMAAEFGEPQWVFGMSTYDFIGPESIITTYTQDGSWHVARLDSGSGELQPFKTPYTSLSAPQVGPLGVALRVGAPTQAAAIVLFDLEMQEHQILRSSSAVEVSAGYLSVPEPVEFPTTAGLTAHGLFYAPQNAAYTVPAGELPPLLVFIHGGPTGAAS
ncbi:MAG TPA: S9 family peptidase, partial [Thermoflexia bacterium]|nr:S9 family peptidase [Thermoflexia bacterium]